MKTKYIVLISMALFSCGKKDLKLNESARPVVAEQKVVNEIYDDYIEKNYSLEKSTLDVQISLNSSKVSAEVRKGDKFCSLYLIKETAPFGEEKKRQEEISKIWKEALTIIEEEKLTDKADMTELKSFNVRDGYLFFHSYFKIFFNDRSITHFYNDSEKWKNFRNELVKQCFESDPR